jgi:hypothetical protein
MTDEGLFSCNLVFSLVVGSKIPPLTQHAQN